MTVAPRRLLGVLPMLTLVLASTVLLSPATAWACSCAGASDTRYLAHADVAFTGTLVERREPLLSGTFSSGDPVTLVFAVDQVHKGSVARTQGVETARSGASCGVELPEGRPVLVFADSVGDHLSASLCGGSRVLEAGEVPLAAGRHPSPGATGVPDRGLAPVVAAPGALVVAAALGGGLLLRRHRRRGRPGARPVEDV